MFAEGGAARFLDVQKHHHVVRVHVELEVIVQHLLVAEPRIGQQILLDRFAEVIVLVAGRQLGQAAAAGTAARHSSAGEPHRRGYFPARKRTHLGTEEQIREKQKH